MVNDGDCAFVVTFATRGSAPGTVWLFFSAFDSSYSGRVKLNIPRSVRLEARRHLLASFATPS